jgi:hypothetical protein
MNNALYFMVALFPAGIKRLTHSYSIGNKYAKFKQQTLWVAVSGCSARANIFNDRSGREGNGTGVDGEQKILTRGNSSGGEE